MNIVNYLKDKVIPILICLFTIIVITLLLLLFNVNSILIIYIPIILFISYILIFIYLYYKKKTFYNNFIKHLNKLDKKYLITEMINKPNFIEGEIFIDSLYDINKSFIEEINNYKYKNIDFKDYIELWCHEIKTPIATSKLIIDNNKNNITTNIFEEIDKINNYVEQVLYYARSDNLNEDYIITDTNLIKVINNVIKRNKKDLINKKIKINVFKEDIIIKSDEKWLEFIINQIIINSIKYSKDNNSKIDIYVNQNKNNIILYIEDNGIGINNDELEKVFDKGYTGTNGRSKYNSTGIGLYLCKKLCNKLGHNISISSILNKKTIVSIIFPNNSLIEEIKN